jgi:hypothetical protein
MGIINIHEAKREGARTVIGIAGSSGSGKTHTAILLADGIANGDSKKIGFLDTENKRGSLYADILKDKNGKPRRFLIGDLIPPFTPDRYAQAIKEFESAGVEVLIIDTVTHEWEGTGGCIEIAESFTKPAIGWNKAKTAHKKFMNTMLQCDMHVICCIRAREQMNFSDPKNPVSLGVQPIQEKNFMFEMTASFLMHDEGKSQTSLKCPAELKNIFGRGDDYITSKDGLALREWVSGGSQLDRKIEQYKNRLLGVTEEGLIYTKRCWDKTPEDIRDLIGIDFKTQLFKSAEGYDSIKKNSEPEKQETSLNSKLKAIELYKTKEWKEWLKTKEIFPEIVDGWQDPVDQAQCIEAVKQVQQIIDQQNAS